MKRKIYPTINEPMTTVACKLQLPVLDVVDKLAGRDRRSRSDMMRTLIIEALGSRGFVSTFDEIEAEISMEAA